MSNLFCLVCGSDSELLTIGQASHLAGKCRRTMYNWTRRGRLHLMQDPTGHTLICKRSLVTNYDESEH